MSVIPMLDTQRQEIRHAQLHTEVKVSLDYLKNQQQRNPNNKTSKATMAPCERCRVELPAHVFRTKPPIRWGPRRHVMKHLTGLSSLGAAEARIAMNVPNTKVLNSLT